MTANGSKGKMMEQRVSLITLGVADVARSQGFYERLGWKVSSYSVANVVTFFQCGGMVVALWGRKEMAEDAKVANDGQGFDGVVLALNVRGKDDVDRVLRDAEAAGARILDLGRNADWGGYLGHFADLDGHVWEIAWNPHFTIEADGAIRLPV